MKKLAITWIKNDDEDIIRIESKNNGFNKFEIIGLLEDIKAKVVFDRGARGKQNSRQKRQKIQAT